jgi:hypothetical protein
MLTEIAIIPGIAALVYFIITLYKNTIANGKENFIKVIPLIAGTLGVTFGILVFLTSPEIMPADNLITAMIIGGASGLSATGTNQIIKQMSKDNKDEDR